MSTSVTIQSLVDAYDVFKEGFLAGKRTVKSMSAAERAGNLLVVSSGSIELALQNLESMSRVWPRIEGEWAKKVRDVLYEAKASRDNAS